MSFNLMCSKQTFNKSYIYNLDIAGWVPAGARTGQEKKLAPKQKWGKGGEQETHPIPDPLPFLYIFNRLI